MSNPTGRPRVPYGARAMSFTMQPCGPDGHPINGGNHYANAATLFGARDFARRLLDNPDPDSRYLGHRVDSVSISGGMYQFAGTSWRPDHRPGDPRHGETIRREDLRSVMPVTVTGEVTVHATWDDPVRDAEVILAAAGEPGDSLRNVDTPRRLTLWRPERARDWNDDVIDSVTWTAVFDTAPWRAFATLCRIATDTAGRVIDPDVIADTDGYGFSTEHRTGKGQWKPAHADGLRSVRLHVRLDPVWVRD